MAEQAPELPRLVQDDPWLQPHTQAIRRRIQRFYDMKRNIEVNEPGGLELFTQGWKRFGFNVEGGYLVYREWAPGAQRLSLCGDFNGWNRESHICTRKEFGVWEIHIPLNPDGRCPIPHNSRIKTHVIGPDGKGKDKISPWIKRAVQMNGDPCLQGVFWDPPQQYEWRNPSPPRPEGLKIYEVHIGIASPHERVATYKEFTQNVLWRVKETGYNCLQIMAIMEHAYYASFGYQVTNFYAISSRFGTPEDLKELIDTAHGMGLFVLLDVVHSHTSKNQLDGLNEWDGTDHQYFHGGGKGEHWLWDSRLFNFGSWEVLRFLLSNLRFYMDEYHFDGFRFDGVMSMIYTHHGLMHDFSGTYAEYFDENQVEPEAVTYLQLANYIIHTKFPNAIVIAEEVSGMPGLCRPVDEGGLGFDFRLGMGIPDMWVRMLKSVRDEDWDMGMIAHTLTNRRHKEKTISYCESHDQALVGDKTIAFWLMDAEMYWNMTCLRPATTVIDRGMSLHKMIRLITYTLGGEGYLTFIGNEFGHPEWLDFPREGNGESFKYACRKFYLADDTLLRYRFLWEFEKAMHKLEEEFHFLTDQSSYISLKHESDKIIAYERTDRLVFVYNFHPNRSFADYRIGTAFPGRYKLILSSDEERFGGYERTDRNMDYYTQPGMWCNRPHFLQVYIPSRVCLVFARQN